MYTKTCPECGTQFGTPNSIQMCCSRVCGNAQAATKRTEQKRSEETRRLLSEIRTHILNTDRGREIRRMHSERMQAHNPSTRSEVVEKGKATKRIRGTLNVWKGERGGNGKLTVPQRLIAAALGWPTEVVITTGHSPRDGSGYPTCYKVDIGNPVLKLAVEVDGPAHRSKNAVVIDEKKERKLATLGWRVLRFTNEVVMTDTSAVLSEIAREIADL